MNKDEIIRNIDRIDNEYWLTNRAGTTYFVKRDEDAISLLEEFGFELEALEGWKQFYAPLGYDDEEELEAVA